MDLKSCESVRPHRCASSADRADYWQNGLSFEQKLERYRALIRAPETEEEIDFRMCGLTLRIRLGRRRLTLGGTTTQARIHQEVDRRSRSRIERGA